MFVVDFSLVDFQPDYFIKYLALFFGFIGLVIIFFGIVNLSHNLTPFPAPRKGGSLISKGIYAYIRHPIYTGIIIIMFSLAIFTGSGFRILVTAILMVVFYYKSELEERLLIERFPEYDEYRTSTGRFLPKKKRK